MTIKNKAKTHRLKYKHWNIQETKFKYTFLDPEGKNCLQYSECNSRSDCTEGAVNLGSIISAILTLYHTILTFNNHEEHSFWKRSGKGRKCWLAAFSPYPTKFSPTVFLKSTVTFWLSFILSSANAFNLNQFKNLLLGKELRYSSRNGLKSQYLEQFISHSPPRQL